MQGEEAERVLKPEGKLPTTGDIVKNPDLATTLEIVGEKGAKEGTEIIAIFILIDATRMSTVSQIESNGNYRILSCRVLIC